MAAAGLNHGGFYKHFRSQDDLVAQAGLAAVRARAGVLAELRDEQPTAARARFIDSYLSVDHRDRPGQGCRPLPSSAT